MQVKLEMQLYNINGIMLSDIPLATYESEEALKSNIVENMIQQYFLEKSTPFYKKCLMHKSL